MSFRVRLAALAVGLADCSAPAAAAPGTKAPADTQTLQALKELHLAHHLLHEANHDYDGHRVRAAEDLHQAIKTLEATVPHHKQAAHPAKTTAKQPAVHEDQAKSDAQLREARKILKVVEAQLAASGELHHQKALVDVAKSVEQIDLALKVR